MEFRNLDDMNMQQIREYVASLEQTVRQLNQDLREAEHELEGVYAESTFNNFYP